MKSTKLLYLALVLIFIAAGCKKKEPQSSQQSPSHAVTKPAKPSAKPTKSLQQAAADGEPHGPLSEIYKKYNQALKKWDTEEIKKYVSDASRKKFDQFPEDLKLLSATERELALEMIEYMKSNAAKDYEVIHQKIESDKGKATLYLKKENDISPYGLVFFVKENGTWKIEKESWSNKTKNWDIKPQQPVIKKTSQETDYEWKRKKEALRKKVRDEYYSEHRSVAKFTLAPGAKKEISIKANKPTAIAYDTALTMDQQKKCVNFGISMRQKNDGGAVYSPSGGESTFEPKNGQIIIVIENLESFSIRVEVFQK